MWALRNLDAAGVVQILTEKGNLNSFEKLFLDIAIAKSDGKPLPLVLDIERGYGISIRDAQSVLFQTVNDTKRLLSDYRKIRDYLETKSK